MTFVLHILVALGGFLATTAADVVVIPGGLPKSYEGHRQDGTADELFRQSISNEIFNNSSDILFTTIDYDAQPLYSGE